MVKDEGREEQAHKGKNPAEGRWRKTAGGRERGEENSGEPGVVGTEGKTREKRENQVHENSAANRGLQLGHTHSLGAFGLHPRTPHLRSGGRGLAAFC